MPRLASIACTLEEVTPKQHLDAFIRRFTPEIAKTTRKALATMRTLTPGALELVYDNFNVLAVGFCPTERAGDGIFSIAVYPRLVRLFFLQGKTLPDPTKRLEGAGNVVRSIALHDVTLLDAPDVRALIDVALASAKVPLDPKQKRRIVIKAVAAKQRARRPEA